VALEQDELPSSIELDSQGGGRIRRGLLIMPRILWRFITKLATGRLVNGSSCDGSDMVIKDLDLDPNIDAIIRDFL
ncbi:hypothetical protein Tco_1096617, partial [Tanacetum coccineum]